MAELFREDPHVAVHLLNEILDDGEQSEMLIVLRQLAMPTSDMGKTNTMEHQNDYHRNLAIATP